MKIKVSGDDDDRVKVRADGVTLVMAGDEYYSKSGIELLVEIRNAKLGSAPMIDLAYGSNPGCAARVSAGGSPRQCGGVEVAAVPWRYRYPTPRPTRLYVCARHTELVEGAEPLSGRDRAIIRARHADRRAKLAAAGRLDLIGEA